MQNIQKIAIMKSKALEEIINLCSSNPLKSWLEEKWKPTDNDFVKGGVRLPVGFNVKTGHWQICDLAFEAFKEGNTTILAKLYEVKHICLGGERRWL